MNGQPMANVLITGAAGNIGSALTATLLRKGCYSVVGIDNLSTGTRHNLPRNSKTFRFTKTNANNYAEMSSIFLNNKFDYVFHFAAIVGVQRTLANPLLVLEDIEGIKNILLLSKNCGVKRVFYTSSSEVYGEPVNLPQHEETTPLNSRLPYAIVKNVGEAFLKSYYAEHGLSYTVFRLFNTYGPSQSEDFVIPKFVAAALRGERITVHGDGYQTRTFCYIDDSVDTMVNCLERNILVNDVLNVGSDVEHRIIDVANTVIQLAGSKAKIQHLPPLEDGDMSRRRPDISRMQQALVRPLLPLEQGIKRLIEHKYGRTER